MMTNFNARKFLMLLAVIFMAVSAHAAYIEIGDGTDTSRDVPTNGWNNFSWSHVIYLASDIGQAMEITGVSYYVSNAAGNEPANYVMNNQRIYLAHTADVDFHGADYIDPVTNNYTLCAEGTVVFNGNGWIDIPFSTFFEYNGTDNLVIAVENRDGSYNTSRYPLFAYTSLANRAIYKGVDGSVYPETAGTLSDKVANIRLHYVQEGAPGIASNPQPAHNADLAAVNSELSWTNGENTDEVDVYLGRTYDEVDGLTESLLVAQGLTTTSYSPDLTYGESYYWRVVSRNSATRFETLSPVWYFTVTTEDILFAPDSCNFGDQNVFAQSEFMPVTLINATGSSITVSQPSITGAGAAAYVLSDDNTYPFTLAYGDTMRVEVAFYVETQGEQLASLDITDDYTRQQHSVVLTGTGVGYNPNYGGGSETSGGYFFVNNTEVAHQAPSYMAYNWIDNTNHTELIDSTATSYGLTGGSLDDGYWTVDLGMTFPFYGQDYTQIYVSTNGYVYFTERTEWRGNTTLPTADAYNNLIAIIWDDLDPRVAGSSITWALDNDLFVLTYWHVPDYTSHTSYITAQLVLNPNGTIFVNYNAHESALDPEYVGEFIYNDATFGIENADGTAGLTYRFMGTPGPLFTDGEDLAVGYATDPLAFPMVTGATGTASGTVTSAADNSPIEGAIVRMGWQSVTTDATGHYQFSATLAGEYNATAAADNYDDLTQNVTILANQDVTLDFAMQPFSGTLMPPDSLTIESYGIGMYRATWVAPAINRTRTDLLGYNLFQDDVMVNTELIPFTQLTYNLVLEDGQYSFYLTAVYNHGESDHGDVVNVDVDTDGFVQIGNGTIVNQYIPMEPSNQHSYSQSIYMPEEIGNGGQAIQSIQWQYNGFEALNDSIQVLFGHTHQGLFEDNTTWIDGASLSLAFNGVITSVAQEGWVRVELDTPFIYNGTDNLVVAVKHDISDPHSSSCEFYCEARPDNRSIVMYSNTDEYYPATHNNVGYMRTYVPNVILQFADSPVDPVLYSSVDSVSFGPVLVETLLEQNVGLINVGGGSLNITGIELQNESTVGIFSFTPSFTDAISLASTQSHTLTVSFVADEPGTYTADLVITDDLTRQTSTIPLTGISEPIPAGETVENPIEVVFDETNHYTHSSNTNNYVNNYNLYSGYTGDHNSKDVVYHVTVPNTVSFDVDVLEGTTWDTCLAIYADGTDNPEWQPGATDTLVFNDDYPPLRAPLAVIQNGRVRVADNSKVRLGTRSQKIMAAESRNVNQNNVVTTDKHSNTRALQSAIYDFEMEAGSYFCILYAYSTGSGAYTINMFAEGMVMGYGGISGTVTWDQDDSPIQGATVTAVGPTTLSTTTDEDGDYSFAVDTLPIGTYTVTADHDYFLQGTIEGIIVVEDTVTEDVDLALTYDDSMLEPPTNLQLTQPTSGDIHLSWDAPTMMTPTSYNVYRDGELLEGTTDTYYDDVDLDTGMYEYYVTAQYNEGESAGTEAAEIMVFIVVPQVPANLTAQVLDNHNIQLDWESPTAAQTLTYSNDNCVDGIGTNGPKVFQVYHRYELIDLNLVTGMYLNQIAFCPRYADATYNVRAWVGGSIVDGTFDPGTMVVDQAVSGANLTINDWNSVVLNTPYLITPGQELWIGYQVDTNGGRPAGRDNSAGINYKGNVMFFEDAWTTLSALAPTQDYNWNIKGICNSIPINTRAHYGFRVYRKLADDTDYASIADVDGNENTTYTDANLPSGSYNYYVTSLYDEGESDPSNIETITGAELAVPANVTALGGNFPNPFNPETNINYAIAKPGHVRLEVYNLRGQRVVTLVDEDKDSGRHTVVWKGQDKNGKPVSSGVYLYKMKSGRYTSTKKMILMK